MPSSSRALRKSFSARWNSPARYSRRPRRIYSTLCSGVRPIARSSSSIRRIVSSGVSIESVFLDVFPHAGRQVVGRVLPPADSGANIGRYDGNGRDVFQKREAFVGNAARLRPARIDQNLEAVQNLPGPVPASELSDNVRADQQGEPARRIFRLQYIERAQCQRRLGQRELDVADAPLL